MGSEFYLRVRYTASAAILQFKNAYLHARAPPAVESYGWKR